MLSQLAPLSLQDLRVGIHVDIIDQFRRHGIHGRIDQIFAASESTAITFTEVGTSIQYAWKASAMGLISGTYSFWKTYRQNRGPDNITFGSLHCNIGSSNSTSTGR